MRSAIKSLFGGNSKEESSAVLREKAFNLLVIDSSSTNWYDMFRGCSFLATGPDNIETKFNISLEQASWDCILLTSYPTGVKLVADLLPSRNPIAGSNQNRVRTFQPHFVLVRQEVRGVTPEQDFRNLLFGFRMAQIPSMNSWESIYGFLERPWIHAQLVSIADQYGDQFPLMEQHYYPNHKDMVITPSYPLVVKMGHAHAGFGKMKFDNHHDFRDFASVLALTTHYCTAEPYLEGEYDIRIQKIGPTISAFKRMSVCGNWKTNTGSSVIENLEVTDQYRMWIELASERLFGGLDICSVDAIHTTDGREVILEVNGTASGFGKDEDDIVLRDFVLVKLSQMFTKH